MIETKSLGIKHLVKQVAFSQLPKARSYLNIRFLMSLLFGVFALVNSAAAEGGEEAKDVFWLWSFLGRLHPMVVHFPISLLLVAFFLEVLSAHRKSSDFRPAISILVVLGALSAVVSAALGLMLSRTESYGSDLLPWHQWLGIATMVLGVATMILYRQNARRYGRMLLALSVIAVSITGHFGAMLTHGEDYLSSTLPMNASDAPTSQIDFQVTSAHGPLNDGQVRELNLQVRTLFAHHCYKCHGRAKAKGKLRLDSKEFAMKGGEDGAVIVPGHPDKSELIRRISLSRSNKDAMPEKGKGLSKEEIALLSFWIKEGAPWPDGPEKSVYRIAALEPRMPAIPGGDRTDDEPLDKFVNEYFAHNKISWSDPVDDRIYIRRVYLDIIGLLPPPDSIESFVNDSHEGKRQELVRHLLDRDDAYAQHWITFWNDALRNDYSGTGYITGGRSDITEWLYTSLKDNKQYDAFVRELISPGKKSEGFIRGIKWRGTINASQRTEMQAAQNVAQVFLGLNIKCASCHDSFISDWKLDDAYAFANVFSDTTLEINRCDKPTGKMADRRILYPELGKINPEVVTEERLKQLADFLTLPKDGRLYRTLVNRIWAQLMGRGIVEPVDVMDNEPWSQDLLDWLASDFVASGYDIKNLLFKILTSRTYQLPTVGLKEESFITAADYVFKGMLRRRLTAEQFADAISQTLQPLYPDSLIVYQLLPKSVKGYVPFARAALVKNDPFLTALGRPNRETVSTSRTSQANLLQALELTNGMQFNETIKKAAAVWRDRYPDGHTLVREIYRNALGRLPVTEEEAIADNTLGATPGSDAVEDFIWSMTLLPEFQLIY